jgi:hypothetical protein
VLVLAGAIIWTRMEKGESGVEVADKSPQRTQDRVAGVTGIKSPTAGNPTAVKSPTGETPQDNPTVLATTTLRTGQTQTKVPIGTPANDLRQRERERERERPVIKRPPPPDPTPVTTTPKAPEALPQVGMLLIKSAPPFAALTINGKPQGETPMSAFIEVPVGKCHIEIVHRLSPPFDTVLNITPGFRREFKFKLER